MSDFAAGHVQFDRVRRVRHLPRHVDRAHAILHRADILENRGDTARDPAGDIVQLPGQRNGGRDRADGDVHRADHCHNATARHRNDQRRVHQAERAGVGRGHPRLVAERLGVVVDGVPHESILIGRAGEQLDGQDVGVAVNHAPGQRRAHLRHMPGPVAQARYEVAQHERRRSETRPPTAASAASPAGRAAALRWCRRR